MLFADAGIPNYLVGPFGDDDRRHENRPGLEEALWLLGIFVKTGKIKIIRDYHELPFSQIRTLILSTHPSTQDQSNKLEMAARGLAPGLAAGTRLAFAGLCRPNYTSLLKSTIEQYGGVKMGVDTHLYYLPMFWSGEGVQEFREKPKILAGFESSIPSEFQEEILRIFPTLSIASSVNVAEASGLFAAISREVSRALGLELAKISERTGVNYDEVLDLCRNTQSAIARQAAAIPGRESIGTGVALSHPLTRGGPRLVRAAHAINEEYQSQILDMVRRALDKCGYPFRRSRIAILGTDGLLKNSWSKPESPPIVQSLRKKGAIVSLYPGEKGSQPWTKIVGEHARVENSLLRAVAKANCTLVALPRSYASELDAEQLASEMNRPGAVCDLSRVLEASNVERAGLFYTTIGRGTLNT